MSINRNEERKLDDTKVHWNVGSIGALTFAIYLNGSNGCPRVRNRITGS